MSILPHLQGQHPPAPLPLPRPPLHRVAPAQELSPATARSASLPIDALKPGRWSAFCYPLDFHTWNTGEQGVLYRLHSQFSGIDGLYTLRFGHLKICMMQNGYCFSNGATLNQTCSPPGNAFSDLDPVNCIAGVFIESKRYELPKCYSHVVIRLTCRQKFCQLNILCEKGSSRSCWIALPNLQSDSKMLEYISWVCTSCCKQSLCSAFVIYVRSESSFK